MSWSTISAKSHHMLYVESDADPLLFLDSIYVRSACSGNILHSMQRSFSVNRLPPSRYTRIITGHCSIHFPFIYSLAFPVWGTNDSDLWNLNYCCSSCSLKWQNDLEYVPPFRTSINQYRFACFCSHEVKRITNRVIKSFPRTLEFIVSPFPSSVQCLDR